MKVLFRAATMAYLKTNMIFETSCSRLDLCIDDAPQVDFDYNRKLIDTIECDVKFKQYLTQIENIDCINIAYNFITFNHL